MSRVTVANPYDLLDDENEDRTNVPAKPKEQKPKAPVAPAAAAKPAATKPAEAKPKTAAPAADKAAKPAARPQQAGGQTPPPARDSNANLEERPKEYRGPRTQTGDRHTRVANRPPVGTEGKRQFDRKSGTGRPANENKKGGQGKGNWGGDVDPKAAAEALKDAEAKPEEKEPTEAAEGEQKEAAEGEKKEGEAGEKKEGEAEKTEEEKKEEKEISLDEYRAQLKSKAPKNVEALKPRTVSNEGFEGLTALSRDEEDGLAPTAGKKVKKDAKKPAAKKESTGAENLLAFPSWSEISEQQRREERRGRGGFRNDRPREDRPPRGGRGGGRGRGPRDAPAPAAPVADLKKDFPSLPAGVKA